MGAVDILSQLLEASWRGISFPTLLVSTKGGHNVVAHKRVDRNGVRVENTGLDGYVYSLRIPFINTIARGPAETWSTLYPDTYHNVLAALEDRSSGPFVHPDLGQRTCKVGPFDSTLDPDFRGGPTVNVTLLETVDDGDAVALEDTAVIPIAAAAAVDLDKIIGAMRPPPATGTLGGISLSAWIRSIGAIADEWNLFKMQVEGEIGKVTNALEVLVEKFGDEPGFSDATNRLLSALHSYRAQVLKADKTTSIYVTPARTTLPALANRLHNSVPEILRLNPTLRGTRSPVVPGLTAVRYYG